MIKKQNALCFLNLIIFHKMKIKKEVHYAKSLFIDR